MTREALIEAMAKAIHASDVLAKAPTGEEYRRFGPVKWEELDDYGFEDERDDYLKQAVAVLSAIEAVGAVVVPVEPTAAMINAAGDVLRVEYTLMIEASPYRSAE